MSPSCCVTNISALLHLCIATVACSALTGCATYAKRIQAPRQAFYANDLQACESQLEKLASSHRSDRDCLHLDLAIVDMAAGNHESAEKRLREVRDRFDFLEQDSITEKATSYWTDERSRSYAGEDYEKILIRAMLSLSNLMHDGTDAESYSLQLDEKQSKLLEAAQEDLKPEQIAAYPIVPFGYYLRGLLREATLHDYDEAVANYRRVCELYPATQPFAWDLNRAETGIHSHRGMGVLYVFGLVGRGPQKVAVTEEPTSDALLIADRIISAAGPYNLPPTIAPIQVPAIELTPTVVQNLFVTVNGQSVGRTETIADIENLAIRAYELNHNKILARAVARRVIKKATVVVAKDTLKTDPLVSLAMDAAGVAWEATEAADTRNWGLLPGSIQVIRIELPAGDHQIGIKPIQGNLGVGPVNQSTVHIDAGRNTYLLGYYPDDRLVGVISQSQAD